MEPIFNEKVTEKWVFWVPWIVHGYTVHGRIVKSCGYCSWTVAVTEHEAPETRAKKKKKKKESKTQTWTQNKCIQTHTRYSELDIVFSKKNARGVRQPHDDPLVKMLRMEEFNMYRVLIDNGSLVDIIYLPAFQQMKLNEERLRPFTSPLVSFTGDRVIPKGVIKLTIIAGTYLAQVSKEIDFLVVDFLLTYNVILGWPTLNKLRATTSTYYLKVKFPTTHDIGEISGDQVLARECYQTALASRDNHTWMIDKPEPVPESSEVP